MVIALSIDPGALCNPDDNKWRLIMAYPRIQKQDSGDVSSLICLY